MKGRTLEVVCPMCETPGYMPPASAGKDVHCCNPECMVPVFKTQKPKVEEAPKVEKNNNKTLVLGGGLAAVVAVILVVVFFVLPQKPEETTSNNVIAPVEDINKKELVPDNTIKAEKNRAVTLSDIRENSLKGIPERANQRAQNRHAEFGYQLAAEAYAQVGDLTKAREQIKRLQASKADVAYLQIEPLVEIGWQQLKSGKQAEAGQTAKDALSKAARLPSTIRRTHDAAISLGALLVALGEDGDAETLIERQQDFGARGHLSVCWRNALDSRTFNVQDESRFVWHLNIPNPLRMGIVETLVARGEVETALKFAGSGRDAASHSACRGAWAGRLAILNPTDAVARVTAAIEAGQFDAATQALMWAAVADSAHFRKDTATAKLALEKGSALLESFPAPSLLKFPGKKAVYEGHGKPHGGLPDPAPAKAAGLAASGLALVQLHQGQKEAGLKSLELALNYFRGMTPSLVATKAELEACLKQEGTVRAELAQALNLPNTEERIRLPFSNYRKQCGVLNDLAKNRLELQAALLRAVALDGQFEPVWNLVQERSAASDTQAREPYLTDSSLPDLIQRIADARKLTELSASVKGVMSQKPAAADPMNQIEASTWQLLSDGKAGDAAVILQQAFRSSLAKRLPFQLDLVALQLGGEVQRTRSQEEAFAFIQSLYDPLIQEDLFLLQAGDAVNRGTAPQLWKLTDGSRDLEALEFAALYRGFISGLTGANAAAQEAKSEAVKR